MTPIFKNGARGSVENYHDVAILLTFGKVFESIVSDILMEKFTSIISKAQHGFIESYGVKGAVRCNLH